MQPRKSTRVRLDSIATSFVGAEYLNAGVAVVCVLDDPPPTIYVYRADQPVRILKADDDWTQPEVLGDFRVPVRRFFE